MTIEEKEHFIEIDIKLSDGTLIGTAEIEPNEKMLERFVIFEPYQNIGYGQQVLSDLIDTYGIKKLWVRSDNEKAIWIYEKLGFKRSKETMFEMVRGDTKSSVISQPKIGKWIDDCGGVKCSYCGYCIDDNYYAKNYCTNCGAKMEVQE